MADVRGGATALGEKALATVKVTVDGRTHGRPGKRTARGEGRAVHPPARTCTDPARIRSTAQHVAGSTPRMTGPTTSSLTHVRSAYPLIRTCACDRTRSRSFADSPDLPAAYRENNRQVDFGRPCRRTCGECERATAKVSGWGQMGRRLDSAPALHGRGSMEIRGTGELTVTRTGSP